MHKYLLLPITTDRFVDTFTINRIANLCIHTDFFFQIQFQNYSHLFAIFLLYSLFCFARPIICVCCTHLSLRHKYDYDTKVQNFFFIWYLFDICTLIHTTLHYSSFYICFLYNSSKAWFFYFVNCYWTIRFNVDLTVLLYLFLTVNRLNCKEHLYLKQAEMINEQRQLKYYLHQDTKQET